VNNNPQLAVIAPLEREELVDHGLAPLGIGYEHVTHSESIVAINQDARVTPGIRIPATDPRL